MRERPSESERQAAREYLEHDYTRRHLTGEPARAAHQHAEQLRREHPRARLIALAGGTSDLGRLPRHLREHQLRERRAAGITSRRAAEIRRRGYPEGESTRRRTTRERIEDAGDVTRQRAGELASTVYETASDSSWGSLIGEVFLWGMLLSIGYLVLAGRGPAAIEKLSEGATNAIRAVISPAVDPLNPAGLSGQLKFAPAGVSRAFQAETSAALMPAPDLPINTTQQPASAFQAQTAAAVAASRNA